MECECEIDFPYYLLRSLKKKVNPQEYMATSFTHVVGSCVSKYIVKDGKREK